ncbi:MAG: alanine--tRNA ligase [Candidatus Eisenbacteria bacterium]|nr:alanine--tRNA ligase [Candidatus Eisenbacteria bacterium]
MTSSEVRAAYLRFFEERGHDVVASAPLVPADDPTLLFTSAGMVPFKPYYTQENPPHRRAVSIQRCLRLSDLDEVGHTPYHGTFFEMLGNFSFGDYFKEETILWAWEFLTKVIGLPAERLWATVYKDDEAAAEIWKKHVGLDAGRVVPLGDEDNFWGPAGDWGPCGPCSEIHYDMGEEAGCGRPDCRPGCDCSRYFEVWNLVFPQYLQDLDGSREPLARPGIDTGMGFERLMTVIEGVDSIHETDLFRPAVTACADEIVRLTGTDLPRSPVSTELAVLADHTRSAVFTIAENILPANDGRGYVVRRLIRRAVRRGLALGASEPFIYRAAGRVIEAMKDAHPHLDAKREHIALVVRSEEERFLETLESGTVLFEEIVSRLDGPGGLITGDDAFRLYDTYGFPLDLTEEMACERGLSVDVEGFRRAMEGQRERARRASSFEGDAGRRPWRRARGSEGGTTEFVGYGLVPDRVDVAELDEEPMPAEPVEVEIVGARPGPSEGSFEVILDRTPFYAEAGGQAADAGTLRLPGGRSVAVTNVYRSGDDVIHYLEGVSEAIAPGARAEALVDLGRRRRIEKNHTATHLLQSALRSVLGDHVHQSGSSVEPERLRFDFTHHSEIDKATLDRIESLVNAWIRADLPVTPETMELDRALERGAMALFDEKYDSEVRVVCISAGNDAEISLELCGGTHVRRTGEIGLMRILSESSVAAGTRRIEAVTGVEALRTARREAETLQRSAAELKTSPDELEERVRSLNEELSTLRKELAAERRRSAGDAVDDMLKQARQVGEALVVAALTDAPDVETMRSQADALRDRLGTGAAVLATVRDGRPVLLAVVSKDLAEPGRLKAGDLIRRTAERIGGKGGGRPHLAQGGGGDPAKLEEALDEVAGDVEALLGGEDA